MANDFERLRLALAQRYRVQQEVGRGGMATVYAAHDLKHDRPVAIKLLKPELAAAVGAKRFLREISLTARLDHPHILPLLDSGEADGLLYYVMPYVEGESLRDRLDREKQLSLDEALRITREVADALGYAHGLGVVHRDVKPENILLSAGHARVADFGIALAVEVAGEETLTKLTTVGGTAGTPLYMSPEQASGDRVADARSDIYSLGCVAYEMLAGQPPYTGATVEAILARKSAEAVPSLRVVRESVPEGVEEAITRALAKVPADRFGTAGEFVEALEAGRHGAGAGSPTPHRALLRWAFLTAAALVIALATSWWAITRPGPIAAHIDSLVVLPLANLSGDPDEEYFVEAMHDGIIGELAAVGALRVISPFSAGRYRTTDKSLAEIATELAVAGVVQGSLHREGDSVRLRVYLIQPLPREELRWAGAFERSLQEAATLQNEAARAIAEAAGVAITPQEASRLARAQTVDPQAFEAFAKAQFLLQKVTPDDHARTRVFLDQAIRADPLWAPPRALLAQWHVLSTYFASPSVPPAEAGARAKHAAQKALELDPTLADAYFALGLVADIHEWDWDAAERAYRRGTQLNPGSASGRVLYGTSLAVLGRHDEALGQLRRAVALDPLSNLARGQLALGLELAGKYEQAIEQARLAIDLDPSYDVAYYRLAWSLFGLGRHEEAVETVEQGLEMFAAEPRWTAFGAELYAHTGHEHRARELLAEVLEFATQGYVGSGPATIASIYIGLGEADEAMRWLQRAYEARDVNLLFHMVLPRSGPARAEPQFQELVRRMNVPETTGL